MGVLADVGFGRVLKPYDEDFNNIEYPWSNHDSIEGWWVFESGFVKLNLYTEGEEERLPGVTDEDVRNYYKAKREWEAGHPCPVGIIKCGSIDESTQVLVVLESMVSCFCDGPVKFNFNAITPEQLKVFRDFCFTYGIGSDEDDSWVLTAYYS